MIWVFIEISPCNELRYEEQAIKHITQPDWSSDLPRNFQVLLFNDVGRLTGTRSGF
jgi:hypothetical protein